MSETLRLRIPARPEYLVLGRLALSGLARVHPIDQDDLSDLKLALTEACTNSIRHAYGAAGGFVEIEFVLEQGSIAVAVLDSGRGIADPAERAGDVNEGAGLGLEIIRAVTDETEIGPRQNGAGFRLRFRKQLAAPLTDEEP